MLCGICHVAVWNFIEYMLFIDLFFILLLILVNGYFSASEIALISLRKSRVRHLVKTGDPAARRVQMLQEEPERFLATVQIGVTLVGTLNMPGTVPFHSSAMYARNVYGVIGLMYQKGERKVSFEDDIVAACVVADAGQVRVPGGAEAAKA